MFKINLENNKGFEWNKAVNICSKGYLFGKKDTLYQGQDLNIYFTCKLKDDFRNKVKLANGSFAVITENKNKLLVAVDRLRSIPLFYSLKDNVFYLSDNAYWIKDKLGLKELDKISEQEFLLTGYVTGKDTLFTEIKQVQAGEYLIVEEKNRQIYIETYRYYRYLHDNFFTESKETLFNKLNKVSENVIKRLINSVNERTIVIPLSGGDDSRHVVAMLKKFNYKNVICFSYGKKGNWESEISKKVADKLGYKWYFIEYTKIKWREWFNSKEMKEYLKYGNNLTSLAHLQDWSAVWELKKENKIPNDAVFVPGHTAILSFQNYDYPNTKFALVNSIFKKHYDLFSKSKLENSCKKKIQGIVEDIICGNFNYNINELSNIFYCWEWQGRHSKFVVNSVRVYEFFGFEWRIPLWDSELMDFWLRVPLKYRIKKELYDEYLFERLFNNLDVDFRKPINKKISKLKSLIKNNKILYSIAKIILNMKKFLLDYYTHPMNWYTIVSYYKYLKTIPLKAQINSILVKIAIENLKKSK